MRGLRSEKNMATAVGRGFDSRHLHNAGCRRDVSGCYRHPYTHLFLSSIYCASYYLRACHNRGMLSVVDAHTTVALQDAE